jgi:hypothetical protein
VAITIVDDSASISTTEYSLPGDSAGPTTQTDDCILQVWIDFANMIAGDEYQIRLYEKVNGTGATQRLAEQWSLVGAQAKPAFVMPTVIVAHGWDVTVKRIAGADRTIGWSIRKVA